MSTDLAAVHRTDIALADGRRVQVTAVAADAVRIRIGHDGPSTQVRYGLVAEALPGAPAPRIEGGATGTVLHLPGCTLAVQRDGRMEFRDAAGRTLLTVAEPPETPAAGGFGLSLGIDPAEIVQGLGDVTRDRLAKRGYKTQMWVRNVASYVPVPFLMGASGWGLFIDTTWRHVVDVAGERADRIRIGARGGAIDIVLFAGGGYRANLDRFTALTGRPALLPQWAYGLTFVCNEHADARELLADAVNFRREGIPCDLLGLEPGWMSKHYDNTTEKTWHPQRFVIPPWIGKRSPSSFIGGLERLGFKLSLWLCCDYDLFWEAERRAGGRPALETPAQPPGFHPDDFEQDQHFGHEPRRMDDVTKRDQAWFTHLKAFVDHGARAFKLDGAYQVNEHPDRRYGNGMGDEEAHNLYPAVYNQQMADGFREHTGLRPMIYSSGGWTGIQRFSATWAGDTGGGPKPLASMLNHAFVGHSNVSCDMDVFTVQGIHFGFLQTWAQVNSWAYWKHPWLLGETLKPVFTAYAKLRYRLLPYLYTAAHHAACTGWAVMRPMSLEHPDDPACAERLTQYYLGGDLIVGAFTERVHLPPGRWYDWWSGAALDGGREITPALPADRGPLYVRAGAVIPCAPPCDHVGQRPADQLILEVWPGADGASYLHEDDGETPAWTGGACARTGFALRCASGGHHLEVAARTGSFPGMVPRRLLTVRIHAAVQPAVRVDGTPAVATQADGAWEVVISAAADGGHAITW